MYTASDMQMKKVFHIIEALWAYTDIEEAVQAAFGLLKDTLYYDRGIFWVIDPLYAVPQRPPIIDNIPNKLLDEYLERIRFPIDIRSYRAAKSAGLKIARSTDVLKYDKWTRTDIFNNYYRPYHTYYELGCELKEGSKMFGALGFTRSKGMLDFSEKDMALVHALYPHLINRLKWQDMLSRCLVKPRDVTNPNARILTSLTKRETDVMQAILAGATNKEAADVLDISENTVKLYLRNIYGKLGVHSRSQLAALFHTWISS